jgi:hypothetical protein
MALGYSQTTAGVTLPKLWRKSQGDLLKGYNAECEEWGWLEELPKWAVTISAREITTPVDLTKPYGTAIIPEGGYEANPATPAPVEATFTWSNYNQRWTTTLTARYLDKLGQDNQIEKQFKYQGVKAIEAISNQVGRDFYGFSTGVFALNTTVATQSSGTYTIGSGYGLSTITTASYIAGLFTVGDQVALVRSSALVANAIGTITAISTSTPSLTITWFGSVTSANNDQIVFANNAYSGTNSAIGTATSFNQSLVGLMDMTQSTSLHSLTATGWSTALADTTAGRYTGVRYRKMRQAIQNLGGGKLSDIIWSNGVSNDVFALQSGSLRFNDPYAMELDGEATQKGVRFRTSRKVPPGFVFGYDKKSVRKFSLLDMPAEGDTVWNDGDKQQDQNSYVFSIDFPLAMVCTNRQNTAYASSVTEQ